MCPDSGANCPSPGRTIENLKNPLHLEFLGKLIKEKRTIPLLGRGKKPISIVSFYLSLSHYDK